MKLSRAARTDDRADVETGNRARRTASQSVLEADGEGGLVEALAQASRHDADHAGMPAFAMHQQDGAVVLRRSHGRGVLENGGLDGAALAVVPVELAGEILGAGFRG